MQIHTSFACTVNVLFRKANMGQENDIRLNELISGIWRSSIALGLFAGPSIAGALYDAIGFPYESLLIIGLQIFQVNIFN